MTGRGGRGGAPRKKGGVVARKRKKKAGLICDEHCETCKSPCDKPLHPHKVVRRK